MEIRLDIVAEEIVQAINNLTQAIREGKSNTNKAPQIKASDTQPIQNQEEVTPKQEPSFTVEEVRKAFINLKKANGNEAVLKVLQKYDAKNITSLDSAVYDAVMKDIDKELGV